MNNSLYFQHDYDSFNDDKILQVRGEFGISGYALFWASLETMAKNSDSTLKATLIGGLSAGYGVDKETLQSFLDFCVSIELFYKTDKGYRSKRLDEHLKWRKSLSESGKAGAEKRWKNGGANGGAIATLMHRTEQYSTEQNRIEQNIKKEINKEKINFLKNKVMSEPTYNEHVKARQEYGNPKETF